MYSFVDYFATESLTTILASRLSIGQAIVQCIQPKSCICPLQVGSSVTVHCGSELLVTIFNKLAFISGIEEVRKFERNASRLSQPDEFFLSDLFSNDANSGDFLAIFAADNADHHIQTLDGRGTFHGMCIITCVTPSRNVDHIIRRNLVTDNDLLEYKMPN